jgi:uncharacterized protein YhdP
MRARFRRHDTDDLKAFMGAMQLGTQVEGETGTSICRTSAGRPPEVSAIGRLSGRIEISAKNGNLTAVEPGAGASSGS